MPDPTELMQYLPTVHQVVFAMIAGFVVVASLGTVFADNLFHSALGLVATLFGVAGIFVLLEAEFMAVSQVLSVLRLRSGAPVFTLKMASPVMIVMAAILPTLPWR